MARTLLILLMAAAWSLPATAQVNRCIINGNPTWQSAPCPEGTEAISDRDLVIEPDPQPWHVGGTLHQSTIREWLMASPRNRLATASDWITALGLASSRLDNRHKSLKLVECIDGVAADQPIGFMQAREIGAACAALMFR